ncbi:MAG TPA: apolipoprotein N-acyltransferase [Rhodoglobus sp.]|nr:apolipoprotein N-acyltransferase [Rhodoglobus sp.]
MRRAVERVEAPLLPLWAAVPVAAGAGAVLDGAFPDKGIWPLALVGVGLMLVTLIGRTAAQAALVGFVGGLAFYLTHISWAALFLGPLPMSALAVLESLFFALGGVAIALAYRWLPPIWPSGFGRLVLLPVAVAGLWTAREAWASVWPYGGFSWGRVGMSQNDGPLAPLYSWIGISGMSFVLVLLVALAVEAVRVAATAEIRPAGRRVGRVRRRVDVDPRTSLVRLAVAPVAVAAALLVVPAFPVATSGTMRVAAVQGAGAAGYFDGSSAEELLAAQFDATVPVFDEDVDVVLWPEGTTYADPLRDEYTADVFDLVSERMDAPLVAQGVTQRDGLSYNTTMLWKPGEGALDLYDKKHPVPFGEYIPDRAFWRPFAPDLIDLVQREFTPGSTDMVFDIDGVVVGTNICFDIVDDQLMTETVEEGAQIVFASSNNADFGRTDESAQQLAIAQIRAMELGRAVVNVSTVGITAVIEPDGTIVQRLPWYEPGAIVRDVPLTDATTPAVLLGRQFEWLVSGLGLAALAIAGLASSAGTGRRRAG